MTGNVKDNNDEEYELVPLNPIRKIERRLEEVEKKRTGGEINKELLDMARINQEVVDDLVKTNSKMTAKIAEMIDSTEKLTDKISSFIDRIEVSGEDSEHNSEDEKKMVDKLEKLEKRLNAVIVSGSSQRRPMIPRRSRPLRMP